MPYFAMNPCNPAALCAELLNLMAEKEGNANWYALVDTAFDHGRKPLALAEGKPWHVYHEGNLLALGQVSPVLLELAEPPGPLTHQLERLLRHCRGYPMLGFVRSAQSAASLRESWQNLLTVETEDGESYLLRFADTRVLPALSEQPQIWNRLAAGLNAWWIIGREGVLVSLDIPDTHIRDEIPLRIGNDALSALLGAGAADAMAQYMEEQFPELLARRSGAENYRLLTQTAALCTKHGISGTTEQYALGVAVLLTDGDLLTQPGLSGWLDEKNNWQGTGMEDALAGFMETCGIT